MILVAVGGDTHHFARLLTAVKHLKQKKKIKDDVVIQYGHSEFRCDDCKCFDFIDAAAFEKLIRKTDVIISHAGAGTILTALKYGKPVVVVPRQAKFKEHVDDHQLQLTKKLSDEKKIIPVYEIDELELAIEKARDFVPNISTNARDEIIEFIEDFCEK